MTKKDQIKKINKKNTDITKYDFIICPNCGETEVGKYCPKCGQSNKDYNKPIKEIVGDLLDSINLDIRLLNTLIPFFIKPGFLTQEYFKGKRKKYVPPMRMYMFFSIIFFFLVQAVGLDSSTNSDNINLGSSDSTQQNLSWTFGENTENIDLALNDIGNQDVNDSTTINEIITLDNITQDNINKIKQEFLNDTSTSDMAKKAIKGGFNAFENKELFYTKFLKNLSYVLFLLMPVFALILAMILWRSKMLYVKHLIFSINFHSFIFGLSSIILASSFILSDKLFSYTSYLWWGIPLYLLLGIRRFYERKLIAAFFKMFGALLLYFLVISIVVISVLAITVKDFY